MTPRTAGDGVTSGAPPIHPRPYVTSLATTRAPHIRLDVDLARHARTLLLALLPCVLIGMYNTGHQAHLAMADRGLATIPGWRAAFLAWVGFEFDPGSVPACLLHGLLHMLPLVTVTGAAAAICERLFARVRRRETCPGAGVVAVLFALCLPPTIPLWQAVLGVTFGVIVGQEIFGGRGRNVFHPAVVGLVFLYFTFPASLRTETAWTAVQGHRALDGIHAAAAGGIDALESAGVTWERLFAGHQPGGLGNTSALACAVGALYLVSRRIASWRVMAAALTGLLVTAALLPDTDGLSFHGVPWHWHPVLGSFAFSAVFLATDPASSACTRAGRWVHGALVGALVVVIRVASPVHADGTLLAVLLGSVFAPLIDHVVVWLHIRRRGRRGSHG